MTIDAYMSIVLAALWTTVVVILMALAAAMVRALIDNW